MVAFEKPDYTFPFSVEAERQHLLQHKDKRGIPDKRADRLLIATWNVANLGLHERTEAHYQLIAEIMSWLYCSRSGSLRRPQRAVSVGVLHWLFLRAHVH
ncbi:hypothetical protein [Phaeodactylibacter sp.]|jgi:hypothetical protein|uniref:hypothetical protein n=1 Tax=Phaeodactylibacter sp. TaxID=1940289 RepID=UPI0025D45C76|nr:hypothetical protein [Phaeodactylibacter sp.]MCI5093663.1 hypothetical protein [Phaeodactylibacter sp.]